MNCKLLLVQFNTLSRLLKEAMEEYSTEQESYREKSKDRIQKQLQYGKSWTYDSKSICICVCLII